MHFITIPASELNDIRVGLEASTIGLPVGMWPSVIVVNQSRFYDRGRRMCMYHQNTDDAEFGGYEYKLRGGSHTLAVFND